MDIWFKTAPLPGIGVGIITSYADIRSVDTINNVSGAILWVSLTFPLYARLGSGDSVSASGSSVIGQLFRKFLQHT